MQSNNRHRHLHSVFIVFHNSVVEKIMSAISIFLKAQVLRRTSIFFKTSFVLIPIVDLRLPLSSTMHVVKRIGIMTKSSNTNPEEYRRRLRRTGGAKRAF